MNSIKQHIMRVWSLPYQVHIVLKIGHYLGNRVPVVGLPLSLIVDRLLLIFYGLDCHSRTVYGKDIRIGHPHGVLLGGNGIRAKGIVIVNSGVKFVGNIPDDPIYIELHEKRRVFEIGHNVFIGTGSVVIGPRKICSNVAISAMSLVNKDIVKPGLYAGVPVKFVKDEIPQSWFN